MQILKYSHTVGSISLFSLTLPNNSCSIATQENNLIRKFSLFGKYKRSQNRWTIRTYGHSRLSFPSLVTQENNLLHKISQEFPRFSKFDILQEDSQHKKSYLLSDRPLCKTCYFVTILGPRVQILK